MFILSFFERIKFINTSLSIFFGRLNFVSGKKKKKNWKKKYIFIWNEDGDKNVNFFSTLNSIQFPWTFWFIRSLTQLCYVQPSTIKFWLTDEWSQNQLYIFFLHWLHFTVDPDAAHFYWKICLHFIFCANTFGWTNFWIFRYDTKISHAVWCNSFFFVHSFFPIRNVLEIHCSFLMTKTAWTTTTTTTNFFFLSKF